MNEEETLLVALRAADFVVGFSELSDEASVGDFLKKHKVEIKGHSTLADKDILPQEFAEGLSKTHRGKRIVVFVPGKRFDKRGTRHGRGGGWYDRFLSAVPPEWLRVGVLTSKELSEEELVRKSWDEPMDYLLVSSGTSWKIIEVARETKKR